MRGFYSGWQVIEAERLRYFFDYEEKIAGVFHFPPDVTAKFTLDEMKYWYDRAIAWFASLNRIK